MLAPNEVKYSNWNNESEKLSYSGRCINQGIATFIADYLAERFNKIKNWTGKRIRFGGLSGGTRTYGWNALYIGVLRESGFYAHRIGDFWGLL